METINAQIFKVLRISELSKVPVLLIGNPGCGKTTTVEIFCKIAGYELVLLRGSQSSPEEILGFEVNEGNPDKTTTHLNPRWYAEVKEYEKQGKKVLLFLDEITTSNEPTQAALLHLVLGRKLTDDDKLPDSCLVVSAGNYSGNLSSGFNLIPPLMNRFMIVNIIPGDKDLDSFLGKYQPSLIDPEYELDQIYKNEERNQDQSFINATKLLIEKSIREFTRSLIKSGELDLTVTEISDIYTSTQTSILPGLVTLRSLNFFREVSIYTYLTYGKAGISSEFFDLMTKGLVGIGYVNRDGSPTPISLSEKYKQAIISTCIELDKNKSKSLVGYNDAITKILGFDASLIDESDIKERLKVMTIGDINSLSKIFKDAASDKSIRKVDTPVDVNTIMMVSNLIQHTSKIVCEDYIVTPLVKNAGTFDLNKLNGYLHVYNSNVELYNNLHKFVSMKNFNYPEVITSYLSVSPVNIVLDRNAFRIKHAIDNAKKVSPESIDTILQIIPIKVRYNKEK